MPSTCPVHGHAGCLWGDEWSLKGLALGAHVDIIVIAPEQLQFYPKSAQYSLPTARSAPVQQVVAPYIIFPGKYGRRQYDRAAEAFADTTRFIMYDGQAHYYAAYKKFELDNSAAPSVSSASRAGLSVLLPDRQLAPSSISNRASKGLTSPMTRAAAAKRQSSQQPALSQRMLQSQVPVEVPGLSSAASLSPVIDAMRDEAVDGLMQLAQPTATALQLHCPHFLAQPSL